MCLKKLSQDLLRSCADKGVRGLEVNAVAINSSDIDRSASTSAENIISSIVLKSGATGFKIQGLKQLHSFTSTYNYSETEEMGFTQTFLGKAPNTSAENINFLNQLQGSCVIVVQTKYKGTDAEDQFLVLGWDSGLTLTESEYNSLENSGNIPFTLASGESSYEQYKAHTFLEGSTAVSESSFEALFANV